VGLFYLFLEIGGEEQQQEASALDQIAGVDLSGASLAAKTGSLRKANAKNNCALVNYKFHVKENTLQTIIRERKFIFSRNGGSN